MSLSTSGVKSAPLKVECPSCGEQFAVSHPHQSDASTQTVSPSSIGTKFVSTLRPEASYGSPAERTTPKTVYPGATPHHDDTDRKTYDFESHFRYDDPQTSREVLRETGEQTQAAEADYFSPAADDTLPHGGRESQFPAPDPSYLLGDVHIDEAREVNILNVDVSVQGQGRDLQGNENASSTADVASDGRNRQDFFIRRCKDLKTDVHRITVNIDPQLNMHEAAESGLIAKIIWNDLKKTSFKDRVKKEKRKGAERLAALEDSYEKEIRKQRAALEEEKERADRALEEERRQGEERVREVTERLLTRLARTAQAKDHNAEKERNALLAQLADEQKLAEERLAAMREQLRLEQEKSEERLNALMRRYEEEKRAEQEKVMTFVLRLEEQHRQLLSLCRVELDGEKLRDLVERLFQNFDIRLLGVDCGLTFLMAAPAEQWVTVVERQMEIEATLRGFLPQGQLQEVTWEQPAPVDCGPSCDDVDLQLGQPLPVQETNPQEFMSSELPGILEQEAEAVGVDSAIDGDFPEETSSLLMRNASSYRRKAKDEATNQPADKEHRWTDSLSYRTSEGEGDSFVDDHDNRDTCPQAGEQAPQHTPVARKFSVVPRDKQDKKDPVIVSMVALDNQRLVLADESNENLKLVTLTPLQLNSQVPAFTTPFGLAKMPDGRVAMTSSSENVILLIDFGKWKKRIVKTAKRYLGIGATAPPLKLIVSCCEGEGQRASVDVITVNGVLVRTIIGSGSLNHLYYPWFLHVAGDEVLISDNGTHSLTRVDVTTGQVLDTCTRGESEYLNQPLQLTQDEQGDVIVACFARRRVLMRRANGDWRGILYGAVDGDGEAVKPMAVAVVGSVLVVAWNSTPINYSVLAGYDMDDVYGEVNTAQSG